MTGVALQLTPKSNTKAMADTNNNDSIRCPCGSKDDLPQSDLAKRSWIECETCKAWQHSICVGLEEVEKESEMPEKYYCEECKPEFHKRFHFGPGARSDNRYDIAEERREYEAIGRTRDEDQIYWKTEWLVAEIEAIAYGHTQALTVEWAKLNGMQTRFQAGVARARNASEMPIAPWTTVDFEHMVRVAIRKVLLNASISAIERFRTRIIKVRFSEAEAVATELWSLRAWLNVEFMKKLERERWVLGKSNVEVVKKYFGLE
jgi:hypothetical protein